MKFGTSVPKFDQSQLIRELKPINAEATPMLDSRRLELSPMQSEIRMSLELSPMLPEIRMMFLKVGPMRPKTSVKPFYPETPATRPEKVISCPSRLLLHQLHQHQPLKLMMKSRILI